MSQPPALPSASLALAGAYAANAAAAGAGACGNAPGAQRDASRPCVSSAELLRGTNELLIEHHGALYRLRLTSLGKLILTK